MSRNPVIVWLGQWLIMSGVQVISASRTELIHPFTGLHPAQFRRLVQLVARRGGDTIADGRPGRPRALLTAAVSSTNG